MKGPKKPRHQTWKVSRNSSVCHFLATLRGDGSLLCASRLRHACTYANRALPHGGPGDCVCAPEGPQTIYDGCAGSLYGLFCALVFFRPASWSISCRCVSCRRHGSGIRQGPGEQRKEYQHRRQHRELLLQEQRQQSSSSAPRLGEQRRKTTSVKEEGRKALSGRGRSSH